MKKWAVIIGCIIIVILAIFIGVFLYKSNDNNENTTNNLNITNKIVKNELNNNVTNDITIKTNTSEEKISPSATLTLKKQYTECGHVIKEYKEIPENLVNLTKEELQEKYKEWEIENFTPLDVTLIKQEEGFCGEHYVLRQKEGVIAVYKIDEEGVENLEEITGVSVEYLTENDKMEIEEGIEVYGKEELNSVLENYE